MNKLEGAPGSIYITSLVRGYFRDNSTVSKNRWEEIENRIQKIFSKNVVFLNSQVLLGDLTHEQQNEIRLQTRYYQLKTSTAWFSTEAVVNLNTLIQSIPELVIVLSSDWGFYHSLPQIKSILEDTPLIAERLIDTVIASLSKEEEDRLCDEEEDLTGSQGKNQFREQGCLIQYWLNCHPEVDRYAILDAKKLGDSFDDHFVHVNSERLLTASDMERVQAALKREKQLRGSGGELPLHTKTKVECLISHETMTEQLAKRILRLLVRHEGEEVIRLATMVLERSNASWRLSLLFDLADKDKSGQIMALLFSYHPMDVQEMVLVLMRLAEKQSLPLLLKNGAFSLKQIDKLLSLLSQRQGTSDLIRLLLLHGGKVSSYRKNRVLMQLIGVGEMLYLALSEPKMSNSIRELVSRKFGGNQAIEALLGILLCKGKIDRIGREVLCYELSKRENTNELIILLLDRGPIGQKFKDALLRKLAQKTDREAVIQRLLQPITDESGAHDSSVHA